MTRLRRSLSVGAVVVMTSGIAQLTTAIPSVQASITTESDTFGIQLTSSTFFADESVSLAYTVDINTPEITEPETVSATPPVVTVVDSTTSDAPTAGGTSASQAGTQTTSTIDIAPPDIHQPAVIVRVALHRPLDGQSLSEVIAGDAGSVIDVVTGPLNQFALRDEQTNIVSLTIDVPLQARLGYSAHLADVLEYVNSGITPVSVSIIRGTTVIAHDVTLIDVGWQFVEAAPMTVSSVAQITGRSTLVAPSDQSFSETDLLRVSSEVDQLSALLDQTRIPLSLAFAPELAASLIDGTITPSVADIDIDQLLADNGGELLSLPYRKIDPSAAAVAELHDRFITELDSGDTALQQLFPSVTPTRGLWLVDNGSTSESITEEGLQLLKDLGTTRLLMADDTYVGGPPHDGFDVTRPGQVILGEATLPITIAGGITEFSATPSSTPTDHAVMTAAQIMEHRRAQPDIARSVVLAAPGLSIPNPDIVNAIEQLLIDDPTIAFMPVSEFPFDPPYNRPIVEPNPPAVDLTQRQLTADSLQGLVDDTGSMLTAENELIRRWENLLSDLFDERGDGQFVVEMIDLITSETVEVRQQVSVPMSGTVNLTGRNTPLPLVIENNGTEPLSVLVQLNAPRLIVPAEPVETVLLPGTNSLQIPVEARTNGSFEVEVEVLSPSRTSVVSGVTITAKAMTLSGFGRLVGFGLILVLLSWWISHLRQQRRSSQQDSPTDL